MVAILTLIFSFFGSLGGLLLVYQWLKNKIHYKEIWLEKIGELGPSMIINFFIETLGSPVFINTIGKFKQYVFVHDLFYADAIANADGQVVMYSITTRSINFNPILKVNEGGNPSLNVILGKTTFADLGLSSGKVRSGLGNRRAFYVEEYYLGNPGLYQTYGFSVNDAGDPWHVEVDTPQLLNAGITDTDDPRLQVLRKKSIINTYTIAAFPTGEIAPMRLGVDQDQIRTMGKYR